MAKYGYIPNFRNRVNERLSKINESKQLTKKLTDLERIEQEKEENIIAWVSYFRENPARFAVEYLGVKKLTYWQRYILHMMFKSDEFLWIASRGIGKTFLVWLYCIIRCILYPGTKIVYTSVTGAAAASYMADKVGEFRDTYPNIAAEIDRVDDRGKDAGTFFHNGSWIRIRPPSKNALGARANCIVIDEYRQVDHEVIERVFKQFLTAPRSPLFFDAVDDSGNKLYADYPRERNIEIYISSQAPTYEQAFTRYANTFKQMLKGGSFNVTALCTPYYLGVKDGIITRERIIKELSQEGADLSIFALEFECVPYGSSDRAYFTNEMFSRNRTVNDIFIPMTPNDYLASGGDLTKNPFYTPKENGEIRLLGVDTALSGSNANSIVICLRLIPKEVKKSRSVDGKRSTYTEKYFEKQVVYIKNINENLDPDYQAMVIKRLFHLFEADYIAIDTHGASLGVIYSMVKPIFDFEYNIEYKAFDSINDEKTSEKCKSPLDEREVVMYNINVAGASAQDTQHRYNTYTRNELITGRVKFPSTRSNGETHLRENYQYDKQDAITQGEWLSVFAQCDALIAEAVNLERVMTSAGDNRVLLEIPRRSSIKRKDRIIALQYALLYAQELEVDSFRHKVVNDFNDYGSRLVRTGSRVNKNPFGSNMSKLRGFGWGRVKR